MTIFAGNIFMFSGQAKIRLIMVKLGLPPSLGAVAVLALLTELPLMLIGKFMTGIAVAL